MLNTETIREKPGIMGARLNRGIAAGAVAIGGALVICLSGSMTASLPRLIGNAWAQDAGGGEGGGHDSGGSGGSGHGGGSGGHGGSGGSGGHEEGGGHSGGGETGGEESKGHGTRYGHQGHGGGQHGKASSHESGGDVFGGGSGVHGNAQVPEGIGRYGEGAPAVDSGRFRYWGGWTLPEEPPVDPGDDSVVGTTTDSLIGSGSSPSVNARAFLDAPMRCEGVMVGMPAGQQFAGANLQQLNAARGLIDPALAASGNIASPFLMGNFQMEILKKSPDTQLAGVYLGLMAKTPVSAEAVKKIGTRLCGRISEAQAKEIAVVAETQRATLASAAKALQPGAAPK